LFQAINRWINKEHKLLNAPSKRARKIGCGRSVQHPLEEEQLYAQMVRDRSKGLAVSCTDLRDQMLSLIANFASDFKASSGLLKGFMKCFNLSLCQVANFMKKIPHEVRDGHLFDQRDLY